MKYLDEFRDPRRARRILKEIEGVTAHSWAIMEVCGGQTHSILRNGIDQVIPPRIELIHGPGCPVCVTPLELIDKALAIASIPGVLFTSFGDMLRVPGSNQNLLEVRAKGGDVRIVYSPLDAVSLARDNPDRQVVFFGVGFETTAPATAMAVCKAKGEGLKNFFLLASHVLVPPAITALLDSPDNRVQAFLAAGHVCTVMGWRSYEPIARKYRVPIVVTGFEPIDLLEGILAAVRQLEAGEARLENKYARVVRPDGNVRAQELVNSVFEVVDRQWRGIGEIAMGGLRLTNEFAAFDAETHFGVEQLTVNEPKECMSGQVLRGLLKPPECPEFGTRCTPRNPLGATMVSSEGACAAYYAYHKLDTKHA